MGYTPTRDSSWFTKTRVENWEMGRSWMVLLFLLIVNILDDKQCFNSDILVDMIPCWHLALVLVWISRLGWCSWDGFMDRTELGWAKIIGWLID